MDNPFNKISNASPSVGGDIFQSRKPFREEFEPDSVVEREKKVQEIQELFIDFVDGYNPPDILISGDRGTGKRTVIRNILELLRIEVNKQIYITNIDCREHTTIYQIFLALANSINETSYKHGTHPETIKESIFNSTGDKESVRFFILENLEGLDAGENIFSELRQARSLYSPTSSEWGIVGISNNVKYIDHILSDIRSLKIKISEFTPYNANELRSILKIHADIGIHDDALSGEAIPKCAALVAQTTGSATEALELLELSGYIAQQSGEERITRVEVDQAWAELEHLHSFKIFTEGLEIEEQLVCVLIMAHTLARDEEISFGQLYKYYDEHCREFGLKSVTKRRCRDFVHTLVDKNLVSATDHNAGSKGGIWTTYSIAHSPKPLVEASIARSMKFEQILTKSYVPVDEIRNTDNGVDLVEFTAEL